MSAYTHWLHTQWPAGTVERLPLIDETGMTNVQGVYIVGDLAGSLFSSFLQIPARGLFNILQDSGFSAGHSNDDAVYDLAIIGAGISGIAAAMEAQKAGKICPDRIKPGIFYSQELPKTKPIYTYPTDMVPAGDLRFNGDYKEPLIEDLGSVWGRWYPHHRGTNSSD